MAAHTRPTWAVDMGRAEVVAEFDGEADLSRAIAQDEEELDIDEEDEAWSSTDEIVEAGKLLVAGGLAGAISKSCTAPLARLTILSQVQGVARAEAGKGAGGAPGAPPPRPSSAPSNRSASPAGPGPSSRLEAARSLDGGLDRASGRSPAPPFPSVSAAPGEARGAAAGPREGLSGSLGEGAAGKAAGAGGRLGGGPAVGGVDPRLPPRSAPSPLAASVGASPAPRTPTAGVAAALPRSPAFASVPAFAAAAPVPPLAAAPARVPTAVTSPRSLRDVGRTLIRLAREEGLRALWRGNGVTMLHRLPYSATNFYVYETSIRVMRERLPAPGETAWAPSEMSRRFVAGGTAGVAACALAYPLDLLRTLRAAHVGAEKPPGVVATLAGIARREGPAGLYRGLGATLAQVGPSLAINYTAYETFRAAWVSQAAKRRSSGAGDGSGDADDAAEAEAEAPRSPGPVASLVCGSLAGLVSSTSTFPLDLVRRRIQVAPKGSATYLGVVRSVLRQRGPAGFYAGILPEYCKVVPGVAIAFCCYEGLKSAFDVQTNATGR